MYALSHLKDMKTNGITKGCFFKEQLTGEETLYHTLQFINAEQNIAKTIGNEKYLDEIKKANSRSPCLKK